MYNRFLMSILTSVSSARSFLSPKATNYTVNDAQIPSGLSPAISPAAYTKSLPFTTILNDSSTLTPDELFTKHTVAEVRAVQKRLGLIFHFMYIYRWLSKYRADADAKQEELRLMVGCVRITLYFFHAMNGVGNVTGIFYRLLRPLLLSRNHPNVFWKPLRKARMLYHPRTISGHHRRRLRQLEWTVCSSLFYRYSGIEICVL